MRVRTFSRDVSCGNDGTLRSFTRNLTESQDLLIFRVGSRQPTPYCLLPPCSNRCTIFAPTHENTSQQLALLDREATPVVFLTNFVQKSRKTTMVKRTTTTTVVAAALSSMLFFSTTSVTPVVGIEQQQQQGECTLACPTDAPCKFGNVDYSGHPLNEQGQPIIISDTNEGRHNINGMHCDCPPT